MHNRNFKKVIVFALVLTMLMPLGSVVASSSDDDATKEAVTDAAADDTAGGDEGGDAADGDAESDGDDEKEEKDDDDEVPLITDEEATKLESCELAAENDKFALYADEDNERVGLYVKETGQYWWSSPINTYGDQTIVDDAKAATMKKAQRKQVSSSLVVSYADLLQSKRNVTDIYSANATAKFKTNSKGVVITYKFSKSSGGFRVPVHYEIDDKGLYAYVETSEIDEPDTNSVDGKVITKIAIAPFFGAQGAAEIDGTPIDGYMIVPDGSGAVIRYNNGKSNYADYEQVVYGRDYTPVPLSAPRVTEQTYMPVAATVKGKNGLVMVASEGDSYSTVNAQVSGQNKQAYNTVYFSFTTRSTDQFYMSGDSTNRLTVYEKGDIKTERLGVHYYPVAGKDDADVNYADCAEIYRNFLIENKGLEKKTSANKSPLYVDFYGGVLKQTSILGLPFDLKTEITGFEQAKQIVDKLKDSEVDDFVINYNDWTNKAITNKISTKADASGTLGGDDDFKDVLAIEGAEVYPTLNNNTMDSSSWGYMTLTSTAIRISNAYSRQSKYSYAFGVAEVGVSPALLSPAKYTNVFDEMISSYKDEGIGNIGFGDFAFKLSSDFSSKNTSVRDKTMNTLVEGFEKAKNEMGGKVIAESANAYVIPYADNITNVPVYSSGFNITDYDIPFYQMVIHGYVPFSGKPINASSNSDEMFMLSLAAGSNIHYDMIYEDASVLQDTDYDDLYYANYEGWVPHAAEEFKITKQILSGVSDMTIKSYERSDDGNELKTVYTDGSKDVTVRINMSKATANVDGTTYDLSEALTEGGNNG
ncbi:MAG: hypothetical protein IJ740_04390 [Ruminococcus sp.]|nr:hypothetical protein [Ruminococcus sp.]